MKKSLIFAGVIAIAAIVYSVLWFNTTNDLKQRVINKTAALGITYDSIDKAGFPFGAKITLTNPKIETTSHVGTVTIGSSLFDIKKLWVKSQGTTELQDEKEKVKVTGTATFKCTYCGNRELDLDVTELLRDMQLSVSDLKLANNSGDIIKIKSGNLALAIEKGETSNPFTFSMDANEFISYANPESYDTLFPDATKDDLRKLMNDKADIVFASHGAIPPFDHPFYTNPSIENLPSAFSFVVDKSAVNSTFYKSESDAAIDFQKKPDQYKAVVTMNSATQATDKLRPQVVEVLKLMAKEKPAIAENAEGLVPDFIKFGRVSSIFDSTIAGNLGLGAVGTTLDLRNLNLSSDLYGLKVTGNASLMKSDFKITVDHHRELLTDARNYYNKWQKVLVSSGIVTASDMPVINERSQELIVEFLESLSESKDKNQLVIGIAYSMEGIKIGPKDLAQVVEAYGKLMSELKAEVGKENP